MENGVYDSLRREFLAAGLTGAMVGFAGCSDSLISDTGTGDGATNVISCRSDFVPEDTSQQFSHPYGDSDNSFALPDRTVPSEPPCIAWERKIPAQVSRVFTGPLLSSDHILSYSANYNTVVTAYNRTDGATSWTATGTATGSISVAQPLGIAEDRIVVFGENDRTDNLNVFAIDPEGGTQSTTIVAEGDGPNELGMLTGRLSDNRVYLVFEDNVNETEQLVSLDWPSGEVVWERTLGQTSLNIEDIAVDSNTIVLTSDETADGLDNVWAVSKDNGSVLWSMNLPLGEGIPVTDENNLYLPLEYYSVEDTENQVRAISKRTGDTVWSFEVQNPPRNGVAADNGRVYIVADNELSAVAADSGMPQWQFTPNNEGPIGGDASRLPIVCRDTLLLGGSSTNQSTPAVIRAVNKSSGELRWSIGIPGENVQSPIPADEALYTVVEEQTDEGGRQSKLYCLY